MKTILRFLILVLLFSGSIHGCTKDSGRYSAEESFEGGKLYHSPSGSFLIAELHGTFHQMGRQYGLLLKQQLGEFYREAVTDFLIGEQGASFEELANLGNFYYDNFPQLFKDY